MWRKTPEELNALLKTAESDLSFAKKNSKGTLGLFNKRDAMIIKSRIDFIKQILKAKKDDPIFIADNYK